MRFVGAACEGANPDLWFPSMRNTAKEAKAICADCTARPECLEYAMSRPQLVGVWGGLSQSARAKRRTRTNRS